MGNRVSAVGEGKAAVPAVDYSSWGEPPAETPEEEKDPNELVLQTWAYCRAKPSPVRRYRSNAEEERRRESVAWHKLARFIDLDCGEDSFFVADTHKVIGVADGVGGWRDEGVDPALFSTSLMANAKLFTETHRTERRPDVIMAAAYDKLLHDKKVAAGSSTACIAALNQSESGSYRLDVANLGDSGLLVVRDHRLLFRAHEKVHGFNAPFQLAVLPWYMRGRAFSDRVADCVRESVDVVEGDVVVMGTDGLFDNRFSSQLTADAGWLGRPSSTALESIPLIGGWMRFLFANERVEFSDPYRVAQRIVTNAFKTSMDKEADSPWAAMLRQYGVPYAKGGKTDDITVVLSRLCTRAALNADII